MLCWDDVASEGRQLGSSYREDVAASKRGQVVQQPPRLPLQVPVARCRSSNCCIGILSITLWLPAVAAPSRLPTAHHCSGVEMAAAVRRLCCSARGGAPEAVQAVHHGTCRVQQLAAARAWLMVVRLLWLLHMRQVRLCAPRLPTVCMLQQLVGLLGGGCMSIAGHNSSPSAGQAQLQQRRLEVRQILRCRCKQPRHSIGTAIKSGLIRAAQTGHIFAPSFLSHSVAVLQSIG